MAAQIPGARLVIHADVGHPSEIEAPKRIAATSQRYATRSRRAREPRLKARSPHASMRV
jgi:hypothetical protein